MQDEIKEVEQAIQNNDVEKQKFSLKSFFKKATETIKNVKTWAIDAPALLELLKKLIQNLAFFHTDLAEKKIKLIAEIAEILAKFLK